MEGENPDLVLKSDAELDTFKFRESLEVVSQILG